MKMLKRVGIFHIFFREIWCYMSAKDYRVFQYHMEVIDEDG